MHGILFNNQWHILEETLSLIVCLAGTASTLRRSPSEPVRLCSEVLMNMERHREFHRQVVWPALLGVMDGARLLLFLPLRNYTNRGKIRDKANKETHNFLRTARK